MIRWLIYLPFSLLLTVICYITNPIVLLFCDEDGELPSFLHMWQTWDNSCNPSDVTENKQLPSFLLYDWPKHYKETYSTTPELAKVGRKRWFTKCIDNSFTLWERIKRYICRVYWLTRNCCYGWAFWVLGVNATPFLTVKRSENTIRVKDQKSDAWSYKDTAPIFSICGWTLYWNNLIGWKVATEAEVDTRAMIANRIAFKLSKDGD